MPAPLAYVVEYDTDRHTGPMEYHVEAVCFRRYYCPECYAEEQPEHAEPITDPDALLMPYFRHPEECYGCGMPLARS